MAISNLSLHSTQQSDDREEYRAVFRKHVFQLLKWGYERLDTLRYRHLEEEEITGDIVKEINEIIQDRSYPGWVGRYSVHEERPLHSPGRKGKKRQRLDIEIERVRHGRRPCYSFEAKRLCANTHATIGAYLGSAGLGEFLSGNYAPEKNEAGMLGYIQSDSPGAWSKKLQAKFKKKPEIVQVCDEGVWQEVIILKNLGYCYRSIHQRISIGRPITLYHLFLVFC